MKNFICLFFLFIHVINLGLDSTELHNGLCYLSCRSCAFLLLFRRVVRDCIICGSLLCDRVLFLRDFGDGEASVITYCTVPANITRHTHILRPLRDKLAKISHLSPLMIAWPTVQRERVHPIVYIEAVLIFGVEQFKHSVWIAWFYLEPAVGRAREHLKPLSYYELLLIEFKH